MASRLYAILDVATVGPLSLDGGMAAIAEVFVRSGVDSLQLRAKGATPQEVLLLAKAIKSAQNAVASEAKALSGKSMNVGAEASTCPRAKSCTLILNDRPDLALLAGFDGCHLGQEDLSIPGARKILPRPKVLGLSTHNHAQVEAGSDTDADYLAIGPIFATSSKADAEPTIGLAEFARLRKLTSKRVVAIGGITRDNAKSVLDAGADSVAMIGDLYRGCTAGNFAGQLERNLADILARIL